MITAWMVLGEYPEEGDCCVVLSDTIKGAEEQARVVLQYTGPEYEDYEFRIEPATSSQIIEWAVSCVNEALFAAGNPNLIDANPLDTEDLRQMLAAQLQLVLAAHLGT